MVLAGSSNGPETFDECVTGWRTKAVCRSTVKSNLLIEMVYDTSCPSTLNGYTTLAKRSMSATIEDNRWNFVGVMWTLRWLPPARAQRSLTSAPSNLPGMIHHVFMDGSNALEGANPMRCTSWRAIVSLGVGLLTAIALRRVGLLTRGWVQSLSSDLPWPPLPPLTYLSEPRGWGCQSLFSSSTLPYLLLHQYACLPFRSFSQPCQRGCYLHTRALGITRHRHFQQWVFGVLYPGSPSIEVLLGPPRDLPVYVFGSVERRHSSKIMVFNPWADFAEVLSFNWGRALASAFYKHYKELTTFKHLQKVIRTFRVTTSDFKH